jgi:hypothetical protein
MFTPFTALIGVYCNPNTSYPELITIAGINFEPQQATWRLLGVCATELSPHGIFEPSGIIDLSYTTTSKIGIVTKRFCFDPISYLTDSQDYIFIQLDIRFQAVMEWKRIVRNQ